MEGSASEGPKAHALARLSVLSLAAQQAVQGGGKGASGEASSAKWAQGRIGAKEYADAPVVKGIWLKSSPPVAVKSKGMESEKLEEGEGKGNWDQGARLILNEYGEDKDVEGNSKGLSFHHDHAGHDGLEHNLGGWLTDKDQRKLDEANEKGSSLTQWFLGLLPAELKKTVKDEFDAADDDATEEEEHPLETRDVDSEVAQEQAKWLQGVDTGDVAVPQFVTQQRDGHANQGSQFGGVMVEWRGMAGRSFKPEGGRTATKSPPRVEHRGDGRIQQYSQPRGYILPYRAATRTITMRPCKAHPVAGCEAEPEFPPDRPPPPAGPPIKFSDSKVSQPQAIFTGPSGVSYDQRLYDAAQALCKSKAALRARDVEMMIDESNLTDKGDFKAYYVNVFRRVKNRCNLSPAASDLVQGVINEHGSVSGGQAPTATEPGDSF